MIGVGFTAESALGTLDNNGAYTINYRQFRQENSRLKLVTIIGIFRTTML
jgi:hypothetical protein